METDYLVVGAGAMGLAFTDTLVAESDAHVTIVDRYDRPGGHWTRAYPFVRLHQPSAYYGVDSQQLGSGRIDETGWNAGLSELATGIEVCDYFAEVMQRRLIPTGRVTYLPGTEYLGRNRVRDASGGAATVAVRRRVVDATYLETMVPSMRPPAYPVADELACVPPNALPDLAAQYHRHVVVGAGKTGIDVCLWLLGNGVPENRITWIVPRDAWLLDRANIQPGAQFLDRFKSSFAARIEASTAATSVDDLFARLETSGNLLRIDPTVRPTMYRCATVTLAELEQLRRIADVVRLGRVTAIEPEVVRLDDGDVPIEPSTLFVDCSAKGLPPKPAVPVFDGDRITLQSVRGCQQVFSAGFIAHVETTYDEAQKNDLCAPIPHPDADVDWLTMTLAEQRNEIRWIAQPELMDWLGTSRLNLTRGMYEPMLARQRVRDRLLGMVTSSLAAANENLQRLVADY